MDGFEPFAASAFMCMTVRAVELLLVFICPPRSTFVYVFILLLFFLCLVYAVKMGSAHTQRDSEDEFSSLLKDG